LLAELDRSGWADWVAPRTTGSHPPHLYYLREEALHVLAERCGLAPDDLAVVLPVGRQELLGRLARIASVTAVNRAVVRLVADLRPRGTSVVDAVACPLRAPVLVRWWPRAAMAYVEVEDDEGPRSVFVAWDRAGATDAARQATARAWRSRWGAASGTAIALVCADARQLRTWERLLSGHARDGHEVPDVVLAMAADVEEHGLLRARWRRPGSEADTSLCWGAAQAPIAGREARRRLAHGELGEVGRTGPPLRRTLDRTRVRGLGVGERVAALAIALTPAELHLLAWTGLHPWLIERQLAVLTWDPPMVVRQRLAALERHGAISSVELPGLTEPGWHITDDGLRAFALAEHDQPRRLQRLGAVYVPRPAPDGSGGVVLPRLLLHELG
ncbi:MAG: hypothetical protein KC461_14520, partial [Dehalococcoidia bacterium]|nr:hypothetical protein [Dehalococcoidia bacterium]